MSNFTYPDTPISRDKAIYEESICYGCKKPTESKRQIDKNTVQYFCEECESKVRQVAATKAQMPTTIYDIGLEWIWGNSRRTV